MFSVILQDRHATGEIEPLVDKKQDWNLLLGKEKDDYTIFKFNRKLITCDDDDRIITVKFIRIFLFKYLYYLFF